MAQIDFYGFVEDWAKDGKTKPDFAMRVTETHSKKEGDKWVTVARTRRKVYAGYIDGQQVQIDFSQFNAGDRVHIVGTEITEAWQPAGGAEKRYDLVVKATKVELVSAGRETQNAALSAFGGTFVDDGTAPF